jgi:urate oxidase
MEHNQQTTDERTMNYGKKQVNVYRTYATPLTGLREIPESEFTGKSNTLLGMEVRAQVAGEEFLPSFRDSDNSKVVATDSMKNFILHHAGDYDGATIEGFLHYVGSEFLDTYDQMEAVRMSADELQFDERPVPDGEGGFESSELVFRVSDNESAFGEYHLRREDGDVVIEDQQSAVTGIELVKVKDNSFVGYVQDEYTTLPERENRTLYIGLDIFWRYTDPETALGDTPEEYVPAEQVRDIAQVVFDENDVNSIQDLVYKVGLRILERFPQLAEVNFESRNQTWIGVRKDDLEGDAKVLREPPRPTGFQRFSMDHSDLEEDAE